MLSIYAYTRLWLGNDGYPQALTYTRNNYSGDGLVIRYPDGLKVIKNVFCCAHRGVALKPRAAPFS